MVVQHNISAMNANRYYGINNKALAGSLEKLSSGYAINRAGDNAAGLAVSEKMRAQIGGLTQASKNAEDGISMVQTFEGALQETDSILQRMRTLAVQSANGNYQNEVDRDAIQLEFDQLNDELNQIADTDFNGVVMLNGGVMADGTVANDPSKVADRPVVEDIKSSPDATFTYASLANGSVDGAGNGTLTVDGVGLQLRGGTGSVELGDDESGRTSYNANVTVANGKVNGSIKVNEKFKIDDKTTNIEIHGNNYNIANGELKDSNGNTVTTIDGLTVGVKDGKEVTLSGKYNVADSNVSTVASFQETTDNKIGGSLDADKNGAINVNGTNVTITNGEGPTGGVTTADGVTYEATDFELNGDTNVVTGTVNVSGEQAIKTTTSEAQTATSSATDTDGVNSVKVNGVDLFYATSGENAGKWYKEKGCTTELADGEAIGKYISSAAGNEANYTKKYDVTLPTTANGTFSYTTTEMSVSVNGKTYKLNAGAEENAGKLILGKDNNWKEELTTDTTSPITMKSDGEKVTFSGEFSVDEKASGAPKDIGAFKLTQGVSTSDAYNHGARNLTYADSMVLQVGARSKDAVDFNFSYTTNGIGNLKSDLNASARGLGTDQLSVKSAEEANYAIDQIDNAINKTNMIRATFGAVQNRLEHKINTLDTNNENLTAAESRIRDTQMDKEMMKFTSSQILSQASQSMLAQANSLPQGVLQLLG